MDLPPEAGTPQKNPKRIRLVFDVSGSMYRFNGYDKRLQRSLETALLCMEALEGKEEKIKYDIVGHSGDGANIPFVSTSSPPKNEKERLNVLRKMLAHTQVHFWGKVGHFFIVLCQRRLYSRGIGGGQHRIGERDRRGRTLCSGFIGRQPRPLRHPAEAS